MFKLIFEPIYNISNTFKLSSPYFHAICMTLQFKRLVTYQLEIAKPRYFFQVASSKSPNIFCDAMTRFTNKISFII